MQSAVLESYRDCLCSGELVYQRLSGTTCIVYSTESQEELTVFPGSFSQSFSADDELLVTCNESSYRLHNIKSGSVIKEVENAHEGNVSYVELIRKGPRSKRDTIVSSSTRDNFLRVWDLHGKQLECYIGDEKLIPDEDDPNEEPYLEKGIGQFIVWRDVIVAAGETGSLHIFSRDPNVPAVRMTALHLSSIQMISIMPDPEVVRLEDAAMSVAPVSEPAPPPPLAAQQQTASVSTAIALDEPDAAAASSEPSYGSVPPSSSSSSSSGASSASCQCEAAEAFPQPTAAAPTAKAAEAAEDQGDHQSAPRTVPRRLVASASTDMGKSRFVVVDIDAAEIVGTPIPIRKGDCIASFLPVPDSPLALLCVHAHLRLYNWMTGKLVTTLDMRPTFPSDRNGYITDFAYVAARRELVVNFASVLACIPVDFACSEPSAVFGAVRWKRQVIADDERAFSDQEDWSFFTHAVGPSGELWLIANTDGHAPLRAFSQETGAKVGTFESSIGLPIQAIAVDDARGLFFAGGDDRALTVYDMRKNFAVVLTVALPAALASLRLGVGAVCVSCDDAVSDGFRLIAMDGDPRLPPAAAVAPAGTLVNTVLADEHGYNSSHEGYVWHEASGDVFATKREGVGRFNLTTGAVSPIVYRCSNAEVIFVAYEAGRLFAATDGKVAAFDLATGAKLWKTPVGHFNKFWRREPVRQLDYHEFALSRSEARDAAAASDGVGPPPTKRGVLFHGGADAVAVDAATGTRIVTYHVPGNSSVDAFVARPDRNQMFVPAKRYNAEDRNVVFVFALSSGKLERLVRGETMVFTIQCHGEYLFGKDGDGRIHMWEQGDSKPMGMFEDHNDRINAWTVGDGGDTLFSASTFLGWRSLLQWRRAGVVAKGNCLETSRVQRIKDRYANMYSFVTGVLGVIISFLQLFSFAFFASIPWPKEYDRVKRAAAKAISFGAPSILGSFYVRFSVAAVAVFAFLLVLHYQEALERRKFLRPSSLRLNLMWLLVCTLMGLMASSAFLPIAQVFVSTWDCVPNNGTLGANSTARVLAAPTDLEPNAPGDILCWSASHVVLCAVSLLLGPYFFLKTLRFWRVGGELSNLEISWNPFGWGHDVLDDLDYEQPLSASQFGAKFEMFSVLVKLALITLTILFTNYVRLIVSFELAIGVALAVASVGFPAYQGLSFSRIHVMLEFAISWVFSCAFLVVHFNISKVIIILFPVVLFVLLNSGQLLMWLLQRARRHRRYGKASFGPESAESEASWYSSEESSTYVPGPRPMRVNPAGGRKGSDGSGGDGGDGSGDGSGEVEKFDFDFDLDLGNLDLDLGNLDLDFGGLDLDGEPEKEGSKADAADDAKGSGSGAGKGKGSGGGDGSGSSVWD